MQQATLAAMNFLHLHRVLGLTLLLAASSAGCKKSAPQLGSGKAATGSGTGSGSDSNGAAMHAGAGSATGANAGSSAGTHREVAVGSAGEAAAGSAAHAAATDDPDDENNPNFIAALALLKDEAIGGIRMDLTDKEVVAVLGQPSKKGKPIEAAATGETVAQWEWKKAGINVLFSDANKSPKVKGIGLIDPSVLKTKKGVGIGSSRAALDTAYGAGRMKRDDDGANAAYTVGNHYYGLVFGFEGDNVTSVYWGVLAE